jgi:oxygen-independent coproporphyrinogen-3 oxidase
MNKVEHLYVHVPFCAAKCHYCAFYSEAGNTGKMAGYVEEVLAELDRAVAALAERGYELAPRTVFFGGGTPSLLPAALMRRLLEGLRARLGREAVREWTVECNPSTVSSQKAQVLREGGVNRISLGVQALDEALLDGLGRVHSVAGAIRSYRQLREAGFDNINLDLMFGLPGQTMAQWQATLRQAIALGPEHLSTYCLILEEDTPLWSLWQQGQIQPDDDQQRAMYETAIEMLAAAGYRQYEVSNFARRGRHCRHNIAYWEGRDYLGVGPGACSTVGDRRWQNTAELEGWRVAGTERLTPEVRAAERAAFGMRMNAGVPAEVVRGRWDRQVAELLSAGLVRWRGKRLQPTRRGMLFADTVAAEFV